jgi:hypothetical protein
VEPEKQSLLPNGSETTFVSRQRLGKHVPVATYTHATIQVPLETVFYTRSVQRGNKEDSWVNPVSSVWERGKEAVGREPPLGEDLSAEVEGSPVLEAVAREGLVKIEQAGKGLAGAAVICKGW